MEVGADDAEPDGAAVAGACFVTSLPGAGELAAGESGDGEVEGVESCAAAGKTEIMIRRNENKRGRRIRIKPSGRITPTEK